MSVSVQLYSVRHDLGADLPGTIARLAGVGFTQVEPYNFVALADDLSSALDSCGINAPTGHAPLLSGDQEAILGAAHQLGIQTVIDPFIPEGQWQDATSIRSIAAGLNAAADLGAQHGIRVGYHNHWWELSNRVQGAPALEYLAGLLDPGVILEVDTYWAAVGGVDPVALLERLGDRVVAIHIKDGPVTTETKDQQPAGRGAMDVPAVISAAKALEVGVVEFDDYTGDIYAGLALSLEYVRPLLTQA